MAVKKVTAKKSAAKRAPAKKSVAKKAPVKKSVAKRTAVKKSAPKRVAKKAPAKRAVVKKSAPKRIAKKAPAKRAATKRAAVKKSTVKKSTVKKSVVERIVIPEAPISTRAARVEIVSTPAPLPTPTPAVVPAQSAPPSTVTPVKKQGASGRVIAAVVLGIIVLGLLVWGQSNNANKNDVANPTATPTATTTPEATPTPTPTAVVIATHEAPQGVVAHYTSSGATIYWRAPNASEGLTGYNVEISISNGPWKLISTVPATQLNLAITKENNNGWSSFKVSSVYADGVTTPAKAFGLPGTFS